MACLHSCTSCSRHVRATESACPFCDAPLGTDFVDACPRRAKAGRKLTRAALLFAGATALAACGGKEDTVPNGGASSSGSSGSSSGSSGEGPVAVYGPAPVDASVDDAADASDEQDAGPVALYGPAPVDAGDG